MCRRGKEKKKNCFANHGLCSPEMYYVKEKKRYMIFLSYETIETRSHRITHTCTLLNLQTNQDISRVNREIRFCDHGASNVHEGMQIGRAHV